MHEVEQKAKKEYSELPTKIKLKHGQGSITYRANDKRYMARYYINGEMQKPIYAKTQKEILQLLKQAVNYKGKEPLQKKVSGILLKVWLLQWLENYKKPTLATSSYKSYEAVVNNHILPKLGEYSLNALNSNIIQAKLNKIEFPRQREIAFNILNESNRKAIITKVTKNNYMLGVEKQKAISKKGKAFTVEEQKEFIKELEKHKKYKLVFIFYLFTGARRNEILSLKWKDIDFINNTITINGTKTKKSFRKIPLNNKIKELLLNEEKKNENIFQFKGDAVHNKFTSICEEINLNGFTVHSLRHTFATRCLESNIPAKVVQQWLGHSNINITLDTYTHIQNDFEREQATKINDIF